MASMLFSAACFHKRAEYFALFWQMSYPFRMPLHGQQKTLSGCCRFGFDRFDNAILTAGRHPKTRCHPGNSLMMRGIDQKLSGTDDSGEQRIVLHHDLMHRFRRAFLTGMHKNIF